MTAEKRALEFLITRCASDVELFALCFFPHFCQYPFNEFHYEDFKSISFAERAIRRARGAPRGYAKSTIKALIKPIHDLCYGLEKFIVIFSNTESQAAAKLKDIRTEILTNAALARVYGVCFPRKNPADTVYEAQSIAGKTFFQAFGAGTEVRGIRYGAYRPSKIILDDVEHSEEVNNEAIRDKYFNWMMEVVSKLGDGRTNIEFVGTILHRDSLLTRTLKNPIYDSKCYKAIISWSEREDLWEKWRDILRNIDNPTRVAEAQTFYKANEAELLKGTKVLWPDKEPYLFLMKEMLETGKRAFMKEKQNEPLGPADKMVEIIRWYHEAEQNGVKGIYIEHSKVFLPLEHMRAYGTLDPAAGQTPTKKGKLGDFASLITGLSDDKGRLFVHRAWMKRVSPSKQIQAIFEHQAEYAYEKFGVETNLYRNLLLPNIAAEKLRIEKELKKKIHIAFYDIENSENKGKRIFTLEPKLTNGWILLNRALGQEFVTQLEDYPHVDHDDGPDALEMLWRLVNNRFTMKSVDLNPMAGH